MNNSPVELDFFGMEGKETIYAQPKKLFDRRRSFRDMQSSISKLNPELLKSVIGSGSSNTTISPEVSTPKPDEMKLPPLPCHRTNNCFSESNSSTTSLTIFYNGAVAVFDVPRDKVYNILKMAEGGLSKESPNSSAGVLNGDLPIARRKSLQRFLEKRQERVIISSPYFSPDKNMSSRQ